MECDSRRMLTTHGDAWVIDSDWSERLAPFRLHDPQQWKRFSDGEVASASRSTNCFKVTLAAGDPVYFKRYVYSGSRLRSLFLPSKTLVEAWGLTQMAKVGCQTPQLLAMGEQRLLGNIRAAFLVTRGIDNTVSLAELAQQQGELREENRQAWDQQVNAISAQLIPQLQSMHTAGLFHYDLKWRNLLVEQSESGCRVHIIDCPRARRHRWRRFRGQVVDLSALSRLALTYLTDFQRLRFLLRYLEPPGKSHDRAYARRLLTAINAHLSRRPPRGWRRVEE